MHSMTGFAATSGAMEGWAWTWDLRSVNAKGLDIRTRVPDWIDGLEGAVRALLTKELGRGSVSVTLRVAPDGEDSASRINATALERALSSLAQVQAQASLQGVTLAAPSAADILQMKGVQVQEAAPSDALKPALLSSFSEVLDSFKAMRANEGAALAEIISAQLNQIEAFVTAADDAVEARRSHQITTLRETLVRLKSAVDVDEDRMAQELAILAVKTDVTEELDRLRAHIKAAREMVANTAKPVGRKLDFLMQEFNREANTLCSKAQATVLTSIGLDLKVVIDQMREQIQNVE